MTFGLMKHLFLVVELALTLPFSSAVVESGFSAKCRITTDWRCNLSHDTISDLLHFSTRKGDCDSKRKHKLIKLAAQNFVTGSDGKVPGVGLSTRRVHKLCQMLEIDNDDLELIEGFDETEQAEDDDKEDEYNISSEEDNVDNNDSDHSGI